MSVSRGGGRRISCEAWYSAALDLEESLSGAIDSRVHVFVADGVKSFDPLDTGILDHVLSHWRLPGWFRHAYFQCHAKVRMRFKLACGLGQSSIGDGSIPQGCPLSVVFTVALFLPWCRYLESFCNMKPQLHADKLRCVSSDDDDLPASAGLKKTPALGKCVLLSASLVARRLVGDMVVSDSGDKWSVKLDVRDLRGHLDTTNRKRA